MYFILILLSFCSLINASFYVALEQHNIPLLHDLLTNISDPFHNMYGNYLTNSQINQLVSPSLAQITPLMNEFKPFNCQWYSDMILCDKKPPTISPLINFIEESHTNQYFHSLHVNNNNNFIGREVLQSLYNITLTSQLNSSVGAIEYQGNSGLSKNDLYLHQHLNNEPQKKLNPKHLIGTDIPSDIETQLDIQMISQTAENADIWFWDNSAWLYSFAVQFFNTDNIPNVISMSWGWSENDQCGVTQCTNITSQQYVNRVNIEYLKLGLRGVTIVVASGDAGAPGRTNELCKNNQVHAVFPGGSPFVTSVGATFIVPNTLKKSWKTPLCKQYGCNSGSQQFPTNYDNTSWTSGGGFSNFSQTPKWQEPFVKSYLHSTVHFPPSCNKTGRAYPDVTVVGHNCPVVMNGQLMSVDGTSCSAPIFAGMLGLLNDYQQRKNQPRLGFANPLLYAMSNTFTDLTQGNNHCTEAICCDADYGYTATAGWDAVTGLGSPNLGKMVEWLDNHL